jgi:hypothetical protein
MNYGKPDRLPFYEFLGFFLGPNYQQVAGEGLDSGVDVFDYFGFDKIEYVYVDFDPIPSFVTKTLQEDERYITVAVEGGGLM